MPNTNNFILRTTIFTIVFFLTQYCISQEQQAKLMFWNFENLFNPSNDISPGDDPYTPKGENHWTKAKLNQKLQRLAKTIISVGEGNLPWAIGFCEVEDDSVINKLIRFTPLSLGKFRSVHYESKDPRGIDVGLIYRADQLDLLSACPLKITDNSSNGKIYREILFCLFDYREKAKLILLINHWPSRYGGREASEHGRIKCAERLNTIADSLAREWPEAIILAMGDFNDEPNDYSIETILGATGYNSEEPGRWINLLKDYSENSKIGTIKHQAHWSTFDQILVFNRNPNVINRHLTIKERSGAIFSASFLLVKDQTWGGLKPFRTYQGPTYLGGFSDHLPVYITLISD